MQWRIMLTCSQYHVESFSPDLSPYMFLNSFNLIFLFFFKCLYMYEWQMFLMKHFIKLFYMPWKWISIWIRDLKGKAIFIYYYYYITGWSLAWLDLSYSLGLLRLIFHFPFPVWVSKLYTQCNIICHRNYTHRTNPN